MTNYTDACGRPMVGMCRAALLLLYEPLLLPSVEVC
jgi:hypothetical protein